MADATQHTLDSLMLSLRARNCLTQAGIDTVEDLLSYTASDLNCLPWLGSVTLKDIVDCLSNAGFAIRLDELHLPQSPQSAWTYILLSERGEIYLGATTNVRSRLKAHNSRGNSSWTKGRRWHILDVRLFESKSAAFSYELELEKHPHKKSSGSYNALNEHPKLPSCMAISSIQPIGCIVTIRLTLKQLFAKMRSNHSVQNTETSGVLRVSIAFLLGCAHLPFPRCAASISRKQAGLRDSTWRGAHPAPHCGTLTVLA
jgi:predicted GIY-YIG superfamily endonuclease